MDPQQRQHQEKAAAKVFGKSGHHARGTEASEPCRWACKAPAGTHTPQLRQHGTTGRQKAGTLAFTWAPQQQHHQHRSFAAALCLFTPSAQTSDSSCDSRPVAWPQSPSWWERTVLSAVLRHRTRHANSVLTQVRLVLRAGIHVCDRLRWTFYTLCQVFSSSYFSYESNWSALLQQLRRWLSWKPHLPDELSRAKHFSMLRGLNTKACTKCA